MERRQFLVVTGRLVVAAPLSSYILSCGSEDPAKGDDNETTRTNGTIRYTSSSNGGHTHTFDLELTDIETPPIDGVNGITSSTGHTHSVTVTAAQLAEIDNDKEVVVTTTSNSGHTHTFALRKI